jgi:predicted DNA binding CopG/RHH family protein
LGVETEKEEETMRKPFNELSKAEQERIELEYHHMDPAEFNQPMSQARKCAARSIRLSDELVEALKVVAELEGEREYQTMVRKWINERLQQETKLALRLSKMPIKEVVAVLKRQKARTGSPRKRL